MSGGRVFGRVASALQQASWLTAAVAVCLLLGSARPVAAQYREPVDPYRFFIDANVGGIERAIAGEMQFDSRFVWFGELGSGRAVYPERSRRGLAPLVDVGGGVMLTRTLGVSLAVSRASFDDAATVIAVEVPHPTFLDAAATASGTTGRGLTSRETAWHLSAVAAVARTPRYEVRVWGGPAFIRYTADLVGAVAYDQAASADAPAQNLTVTGFDAARVSASTVGASVGADLTVFVTDTIGIGAGLRFTRGIVAIDPEPMSDRRQEVLVGSALVVMGLRVRLARDAR